MEAALEVMDEDIVIVIPPDVSAEPDTYRGHEGVRRYFAGFEGMLEDVRYETFELIPEGDHVLAHARLGGRGVSSGLEVDLETGRRAQGRGREDHAHRALPRPRVGEGALR